MELTLIIIVVVSVFALIFITVKSREEDDDTVKSDTSGSGGTTSKDTQSGKEKPSGPQQNTIYEFAPKAGTRLCPFCDGENNVGSSVCDICGRSI